MLGLCCYASFSLVVASGGYSLVVCRLLIAVTSPVETPRLQSRCIGFSSCSSGALEHSLSSCGAWAKLHCGIRDLPGPGIEPVSPALAGGFFTAEPPGKP